MEKMKNKMLFWGMSGVLLAFALMFASCDSGGSGGAYFPIGGGGGAYHLKWGIIDATYTEVRLTITSQGWAVAGSGTNWALGKDNTATTVYNYCTNNLTFVDYGDFDGSLEQCINFSMDGVSAPSGLKTSARSNSGSMPLAGIFDGGGMAVLFYIKKN